MSYSRGGNRTYFFDYPSSYSAERARRKLADNNFFVQKNGTRLVLSEANSDDAGYMNELSGEVPISVSILQDGKLVDVTTKLMKKYYEL